MEIRSFCYQQTGTLQAR